MYLKYIILFLMFIIILPWKLEASEVTSHQINQKNISSLEKIEKQNIQTRTVDELQILMGEDQTSADSSFNMMKTKIEITKTDEWVHELITDSWTRQFKVKTKELMQYSDLFAIASGQSIEGIYTRGKQNLTFYGDSVVGICTVMRSNNDKENFHCTLNVVLTYINGEQQTFLINSKHADSKLIEVDRLFRILGLQHYDTMFNYYGVTRAADYDIFYFQDLSEVKGLLSHGFDTWMFGVYGRQFSDRAYICSNRSEEMTCGYVRKLDKECTDSIDDCGYQRSVECRNAGSPNYVGRCGLYCKTCQGFLKRFTSLKDPKYSLDHIQLFPTKGDIYFQSSINTTAPISVNIGSMRDIYKAVVVEIQGNGALSTNTIYDKIEGGKDFALLRVVLNEQQLTDLGIDNQKYKRIISKAKLQQDSVTLTTFPYINITAATIVKIMPSQILKDFFSSEFKGSELFRFEKIVLHPNWRICIHVRHASPREIIKNKFYIKNTTFEYCDENNGYLRFNSYYNKENIFNTSTVLDLSAEFDGQNHVQEFHGTIKMFDINYIQNSTGCNMTTYYYQQTFANLLQFPLNGTHFTYRNHQSYIRFHGHAIINNITFDMQVVYDFGRRQPATAMALDKTQHINGKKTKGLVLIELLRYLFGTWKLDVQSLVSFDKFCICIQKYDFYESADLQKDYNLKCNNIYTEVEYQYRHEVEEVKKAQIFIRGSDFYRDCEISDWNTNEICEFLSRTWKNTTRFREKSTYYGYITPMAFKINVTLDTTINLSNNIKIKGMDGTPVSHVVEANLLKKLINEISRILSNMMKNMYTKIPDASKRTSKDEDSDITILTNKDPDYQSVYNKARGCLVINDQTDKRCLAAELRFIGNSIFIEIPEIEDPTPSDGFLGIPDVNEYLIRARPYEINKTVPVEYIVFNSDLKIGSIEGKEIDMKGEVGLTEQHMYDEKTKNRFFMCKRINETINLQDVFNAFGLDVKTENVPLLKGILLKRNCFTYTHDAIWDVTTEGVIAQRGLWLHAKTVLKAIDTDGTTRDFTVDVKIKLDGKKTMKLELPPIRLLEIPSAEDATDSATGDDATASKNMKRNDKEFKLFIMATNVSQDVGPTLEIDFQGRCIGKAKLRAYIKTIGFEGLVNFTLPADLTTMNFDRTAYETDIINKRTETPNSPETEAVARDIFFSEGYNLHGVLSKDNNFGASNFQFRYNAETKLDAIKTNYVNIVERRQTFMLAKIENATKLMNNITKKVPHDEEVNCSELERSYRSLVQSKRNHQDIQNEMNKRCVDECKMMFTPGFKWNNKCNLSARMSNVTCLSFKRNALLSANMKCIANCEVNRIKAFERSTISRRTVQENANQFEEDSQRMRLFCDLQEIIQNTQKALQLTINSKMKPRYDFITQNIKLNPIEVLSLCTSYTDFSVYTKPLNLTFDIQYKHVNNEVRNEQLTIQTDAALPRRVAKYYLDKQYQSKFDEFNSFMEEIVKEYEEGIELIENWKVTNKEFLKIYNRKYKPASYKRTIKYLNTFNIDEPLQHSDEPHQLKHVIKHYAPWNVLPLANPFRIKITHNNAVRKSPIIQVRSACASTRNKLAEYKDMIQYMKSWSTAYDEGRQAAFDWKSNINKGLSHFTNKARTRTVSNNTILDIKESIDTKWASKLKTGFTSWENELNKQLYSLYVWGPKLMKNEMNAIFTPQGYQNLDNFIQSAAKPLDDGYTRSMNSNDKPFQQISQLLVNGINNMKSIDDNKVVIERVQSMIDNIEKTETRCHDEL